MKRLSAAAMLMLLVVVLAAAYYMNLDKMNQRREGFVSDAGLSVVIIIGAIVTVSIAVMVFVFLNRR